MYKLDERRRIGAERILDSLCAVDDLYLNEAFITDDAEKMAILKRDVKPKKQRERSGYKLLYRVAACVVCFFIKA